MAEFHWVGATGNTIDKYDWNDADNWITYTSSGYAKATTTPTSGDTVYVGQRFHCLSPLLFGGYTGNVSHNTGWWGYDGSALSLTAGVTDGGVELTYVSNIQAADDSSTVNLATSIANLYDTIPNPTDDLWSGATASANYIKMLEGLNPHSARLSVTGAAVFDAESSLYPFPYLGGGVTGEVYQWLCNQHEISYNAFNYYHNDAAKASANAWVGGGFSGNTTARASSGLTVRHNDLNLVSGTKVVVNANVRKVDLNLVHDFDSTGIANKNIVKSAVNVEQEGNPNHFYTLRNGITRNITIKGDAGVALRGSTAAEVYSDVHATLQVHPGTVLSMVSLDTGSGNPRYSVYPLYFAGTMTSGAYHQANGITAGEISSTVYPKGFAAVVCRQANVYDANTSNVGGGYGWPITDYTTWSPRIAIGAKGSGNGATAYAVIPELTVQSPLANTKPGTVVAPAWSLEFWGSSKIGRANVQGGYVSVSPEATHPFPVTDIVVGELNISNNTTVDFTVNQNVDNFFVGGLSANSGSSVVRLVGGINALDESCTIKPSAGIRLVNSKQRGYKDIRTTRFVGTYTNANQANSFGNLASLLGIQQPVQQTATE